MEVSYKKLWKLLIDHDMKKTDLKEAVNISTNTLSKLGKNEIVGTEILIKIATYFKCGIDDIMDVVETNTVDDAPIVDQAKIRTRRK